MNFGMNLFFATAWFIMIGMIMIPESVGEWRAERDVAYDAHYMANCECVEATNE